MDDQNNLIAKFMGSEPYNDGRYGIMWPDPTNENKVGFGLHYDTKWDWLMPVVEKIERLSGVTVVMKKSRCRILVGKKVFSCHTIVKLNSTYRVVVEFIKWLDTTKQPQPEQSPGSQDVK